MSAFDPLLAFYGPIRLICLSISFLPRTILNMVLNSSPPKSYSAFKHDWFATFWTWFGPQSSTNAAPVVRPLLKHAGGKVLDIGPGQGHFLSLYDISKIKVVYAVEPNRSHHPQLRANAKAAGFTEGKNFILLDCLIETLESAGRIPRSSIDTIVTLQVLCSIPDPEVLIPELRTYLRPQGGKWIVYEHVECASHTDDPSLRNKLVKAYQSTVNVVWPQFFNGCHLNRRTAKWIEATGGWEERTREGEGRLGRMPGDNPWSPLPTMCGVLVSK